MSSDIAVAGDARIEEKQKEKYQDLRGRRCKCYCNALTVWGFGYNDEGTDLVMFVHFRVF